MFYSPFEKASNNLAALKKEFEGEKLFFSEDLTCKKCKTRLSDFMETGYVGCSECYKLFDKDVMGLIYNFHKAAKHTGKRPEFIATKAKLNQQIDSLLKQQAEASAAEDYILAQSIKEQIALLREKL